MGLHATGAFIVPLIETPRLLLVSLGLPALQALLKRDRDAAARILNCRIPADVSLDDMPLTRRLSQLRADPDEQPWLLRAMVDRDSRNMIGHIGFHSYPGAKHLAQIAPGGVELGYTVNPSQRRQGYATESALGLMNWAFQEHHQRCFVLSISPSNLPSNSMARSLGFLECGSDMDEEDGLEIIFVRNFETWPNDWAENISRF